jgi:WD40 repeat protein
MYTLFGHEGASSCASWSPLADYFVTGGNDSVVLAWQSNLNSVQQEDLSEIKAKIETDVFVTQKEKVDRIPEGRGTKMGKNKENKSKLANKSMEEALDENAQDQTEVLTPAKKLV